MHQSHRRRYRAQAKSSTGTGKQRHLHLSRLEQSRDYQRLLARLVELSERFQRSLTAEQRRTWLTLEDALSDHAWLLHGHYFKAGYQLGKATRQRRASGDRPPGSVAQDLSEQAVLLSALSKLLERLTDAGS
ncbi:MAG TPA: hypothetical protein VI197_23610 [Polyangiaceae bacterium]